MFRVSLPVWTPGSYLIREYAKHVINVKAWVGGSPVKTARLDKASWAVSIPPGSTEVSVEYDVWAYEMTVRTSYLDSDYGIISPASVFIYHPEWKGYPCTVKVHLPPGWDLATGLEQAGGEQAYTANDYDVLVDSPLQMGSRLRRHPFFVDGVPHTLVVAGSLADVLPRPDFISDLTRIIETARGMFGTLPYSHYTFMVTVTENGGGGLEHLNSANIMVRPNRWRANGADYPRLLSLFAHEYFHLWNVKRLHPDMLGPFDYQSEVYTSLLWAMEGVTDYFALWLLGQSRVVQPETVLAHWAESLAQYERLPGRLVTPVAESSRESWIRQYRPDANTPNITVSYYLKGALVGLFLDVELRHRTDGRVSLPLVVGELWKRYADRGFPESAYEDLVVEMGGPDLRGWLDRYVHGVEAFDDRILSAVGIAIERRFKDVVGERPAWAGLTVAEKEGRVSAQYVEHGGPSERGGLSPDAEILGVDGLRIHTAAEWKAALTHVEPGTTVSIHMAHRGEIGIRRVTVEAARPDDYHLVPVAEPTERQRRMFLEWMGAPIPDPGN